MSQAGKTTAQLNQANGFYNSNDCIVILYGKDTANTANSVAQTSIISVNNFAASFAQYLEVPTQQADPANATALTINQGLIFFSNTFGYVAIANNVLRRFAISSF